MKVTIVIDNITDETIGFIHQSIDNAHRHGVRMSVAFTPSSDPGKTPMPQFPDDDRKPVLTRKLSMSRPVV